MAWMDASSMADTDREARMFRLADGTCRHEHVQVTVGCVMVGLS